MAQKAQAQGQGKRKKKWLQRAIKRPGAFTQWCKSHGYKSVNKSCIARAKEIAKQTGNRSLLGQAVLAERFKYGDLAKARRKRGQKGGK